MSEQATAPPPAADAAAPALSFADLSLTFADGTHALAGINLAVRPGEFVSILGPSGCGKSTLLRVAAGLVDYSAGALNVDRAHLGFTFQDATLLPWRTVRRNVELLLELRGAPPAERRRIAQEKIALVGLSGFEEHHPKQLSGGMKMRASLARSLTLDPKIFLFDEPFGALDEVTRERLNDELLALYARQGFTALFVTHSIAEAAYLSSRVVVMSARPGRIVAEFAAPFPYPRRDEIRYSADFARLSGEVSAALRAASAT
ncbi:MAG: ABC transporter ATP-binding protein [Hyphomonadaceae bacterium]|nr:ABC transporter ATP-binding protein [Hyphomonadaceae bacterium]